MPVFLLKLEIHTRKVLKEGRIKTQNMDTQKSKGENHVSSENYKQG